MSSEDTEAKYVQKIHKRASYRECIGTRLPLRDLARISDKFAARWAGYKKL